MPLKASSSEDELAVKKSIDKQLNDALHLAREFAGEIEKMLRRQGLPILDRPGNFPDISKKNITEFPSQELNQLQAEFINAASYVNNRLAIAKVELSYQKYLIKIRKANLEVQYTNKKVADVKRIINIDPEVNKLEAGREYLHAISNRYTVYYELYIANQAVLSREQSRRGAQHFNKIP